MLEGIGIGAGVGLLAIVVLTIAFISLLRGSQGQTNRADSRANELAKRLDTSIEDGTELEKQIAIFTTNERELKRELAGKQATIVELEARVASAKKARDDLAQVLQDNPGAVTAAVGVAFDRLRESLSRAKDPAATTTGDPSPREAGGVHEEADVGASRR